ncbi:MAG: SIS domain-containing protein, partial [Actinomycetota bacterium]|nr:SIS domain-containing protein [Actinomycetota bacterium]
MCGIVAVVRRPTDRRAPEVFEVTEAAARAEAALAQGEHPVEAIESAAEALEVLDARLGGVVGTRFLVAHPDVADELAATTERLARRIDDLDRDIDDGALALTGRSLEAVNAALVRLRDAQWAVAKDRLGSARAVADLAGADAGDAAIAAFTSVQTALSALDRLEVRGRDSAGLHLLVDGHGLDLADPAVAELVAARSADPLFTSGSVRTPLGCLSLVYKAAAEIGELGDNTRALRRAIAADPLLHRALAAPGARVTVLGHTRWASVGIVSEANAHPLNHEEEGEGGDRPYVTVAVNGDVDNHGQLRSRHRLRIPLEVTCDTKVVPALVSRQMASCDDAEEAFRTSVAELEGSLAIAASTAESPHRLLLALRGSGQALYVGLADDAYVVASEPYGVVGETRAYVRMDGEAGFGPSGVRGQVIALDGDGVGLEGLRRWSYDGTPLPLGPDDIHSAEVTTRDIDRGPFPHYLLKELSEAPQSWARTIRGRIEGGAGRLRVVLGDDVLPVAVRKALADRSLVRVVVIGQGTAAVAGQSVAAAIAGACSRSSLRVEAMLATELSGFALDDDMSDTLVVPVSQSGTTTDTNRTVDLVRARGAAVVAIVNRRNSDLVEKADGVLFTSDGRDVEMSVASTKAFYAQVAAGFLLAEGIAEVLGCADHARASAVLDGLRRLPAAMGSVLAQREHIAAAAARHAPPRSAWAVVGNGANRVAAEEVRIKLSELCYKSIACDATEDKKHIDLSSEPLVFVCAAGLAGPNADDVAKEVAIYRAHKAVPVVVATEGQAFPAAVATVAVPPVHPALAFVLSAMAGHLFGYGAALAIDHQALVLREARAAIEAALSSADDASALLERLAPVLAPVARRVLDGLRSGAYDGHLPAAEAL